MLIGGQRRVKEQRGRFGVRVKEKKRSLPRTSPRDPRNGEAIRAAFPIESAKAVSVTETPIDLRIQNYFVDKKGKQCTTTSMTKILETLNSTTNIPEPESIMISKYGSYFDQR
jgi:hypothetical protein